LYGGRAVTALSLLLSWRRKTASGIDTLTEKIRGLAGR
jgi:hypothetical protein